MTDDIVQEATYPYPPAVVWRALTDPAAIGSWLMETDFKEPVVGHRFQFRDKPRMGWSGVTDCEVVEVVPEKRFVYRFGDAAEGFPATRVIWEMEPAGPNATRVRFRHTGFVGFKGWMMRAGMNNGWWRIIQFGIPYVIAQLQAGRTPARDETKAHAKSAARGEHKAMKARA